MFGIRMTTQSITLSIDTSGLATDLSRSFQHYKYILIKMQLSTLIPFVALGISAVSAEYCTQALDPYPRKASTGFRFESVDANNWKWTSRDVQVVTTVSPQGGNCQIHQGGGGGEFSATICIDFKGNYACWVTPSKNQVCDMVFEQDEAPVDVCGNIKNIWGWVA